MSDSYIAYIKAADSSRVHYKQSPRMWPHVPSGVYVRGLRATAPMVHSAPPRCTWRHPSTRGLGGCVRDATRGRRCVTGGARRTAGMQSTPRWDARLFTRLHATRPFVCAMRSGMGSTLCTKCRKKKGKAGRRSRLNQRRGTAKRSGSAGTAYIKTADSSRVHFNH